MKLQRHWSGGVIRDEANALCNRQELTIATTIDHPISDRRAYAFSDRNFLDSFDRLARLMCGRLPRLLAHGFRIRHDLIRSHRSNHRLTDMACVAVQYVAMGHVWTAPGWQVESSLCGVGRSGHMFGLFAR